MKYTLFISLFFFNFINAQNLKVEYEYVNKQDLSEYSSESSSTFKRQAEEKLKKAQKQILYFYKGNTFYKNIPTEGFENEKERKKVDERTTSITKESFVIKPIKIYHKKNDPGFYQYQNFGDEEYYKYYAPKFSKVEYKDNVEQIEKYTCKLAEVTLNSGGLVKVWYAEDFPVSAGPYVYNSFPGLVLKVESPNFIVYATKISNDGKETDFEPMNSKLKVLDQEKDKDKIQEIMKEASKVKETHTDIRL
ncbi:GLPGLI family protein [Chryseobacterium carnipullorum]|uniref:GLPGLI family protein n=1 Tax=Chryseobacterium carnipullorum TaxID=1124835 RepID=A0A376DMT6_CHRCU|nr:GLPGLI family protein [Chryseobacterium carnipullorum]AZA48368.1 GLPGLI family protein [Chryseobacterium carnipullorum]STC92043.1 GLPGLI family protein [Chryseobacterium carnipullorum]